VTIGLRQTSGRVAFVAFILCRGTWHVTCIIAVALMATARTIVDISASTSTAVVSVTVVLLISLLVFASSLMSWSVL
jgi:hypothetical protein